MTKVSNIDELKLRTKQMIETAPLRTRIQLIRKPQKNVLKLRVTNDSQTAILEVNQNSQFDLIK